MPEAPVPENDRTWGVTGISVAATSIVALPSMLVGAMAVLMQRDLSFGESELGIAVAVTFAVGAAFAIPAGHFADRAGPQLTMRIGLAFGAISLLGIGLLTGGWLALLGWMAFAGAGVTMIQLGTNVLITRAVPAVRRGIAFGTKQAAVPLASMGAGLAVPIIGVTYGWQATFIAAAVAVPIIAVLIPNAERSETVPSSGRQSDVRIGILVLLAIGVAFASAGGNSTPAFLVPSIVDRGISPTIGGLILAGSSLVGVASRVVAGWVGDAIGRNSLVVMATMMGFGAIGFVGLAVASDPLLIAGFAALAFGGGWGWGGLTLLAVSRLAPVEPGRAMGIVQIGPMAGAVVGPLVFGFLAEAFGFTLAWGASAFCAIAGLLILLLTRRALRRTG